MSCEKLVWHNAKDCPPKDDTPVIGVISRGYMAGKLDLLLEVVCYSSETHAWRLRDVPEPDRYVPVMLWTSLEDWQAEIDRRVLYGVRAVEGAGPYKMIP